MSIFEIMNSLFVFAPKCTVYVIFVYEIEIELKTERTCILNAQFHNKQKRSGI